VPSPRSAGVVAQYTCEVGYQLTSGSEQRTCNASFAWDGAEPICKKVPSSVLFHQLCYNCDIVDSKCPSATLPASFEECRTTAITNSAPFVKYHYSRCQTFACDVPRITYTSGSVTLFFSLKRGIYYSCSDIKTFDVIACTVNAHVKFHLLKIP